MRSLALTPLLLLTVACSSTPDGSAPVAGPPVATQLEEHRWLRRFVGDWEVRTGAGVDADGAPVELTFDVSCAPIGDLWVVSSWSTDFEGAPYAARWTMGYDPGEEAFVGTWIDSLQPDLWHYRGRLDGEALVIETEGPLPGGDGATARFRERFEFDGPDAYRMTVTIDEGDGAWAPFMSGSATRVGG